MEGCDAPTSSSWNAPFCTKTSAWFELVLLFGLDFSTCCTHMTMQWKGRHEQSKAEKG